MKQKINSDLLPEKRLFQDISEKKKVTEQKNQPLKQKGHCYFYIL